MNIRYEFARAEQAAQLAGLRETLLMYHGEEPASPEVMQRMEDFFRRGITEGFCWVVLAYDGDTLVGHGTIYTYQRLASMADPSGKTAYITDIWTKDTHRRRGIATEIVNRLLEVGFAHAEAVRLHASEDGKKLYPRLGFVPSEGDFVCRRKR